MSDISPEDRETLVKVKYGELWDDAFKTRLENPQFVEMLKKLLRENPPEHQEPQRQEPQRQQQPSGKRSLLEMTLGL